MARKNNGILSFLFGFLFVVLAFGVLASLFARLDTCEHEWDDGVVKTEATCTSAGRIEYECELCGETKTKKLPLLEHIVVVEEAAVEPTCTTPGWTESSYCEVCNVVLSIKTEIAAFGHSAKVLPAVAATCTESGLTSGEECLHCGLILKVQETVEPTGHFVDTNGYCSNCSILLDYELAVAGLEETDVVVGESVAGNLYRLYISETTNVHNIFINFDNGWRIGAWSNMISNSNSSITVHLQSESSVGYGSSLENIFRSEGYIDFYIPLGETISYRKMTGPDSYDEYTMTFDDTITISGLEMPEGFSIKRLVAPQENVG